MSRGPFRPPRGGWARSGQHCGIARAGPSGRSKRRYDPMGTCGLLPLLHTPYSHSGALELKGGGIFGAQSKWHPIAEGTWPLGCSLLCRGGLCQWLRQFALCMGWGSAIPVVEASDALRRLIWRRAEGPARCYPSEFPGRFGRKSQTHWPPVEISFPFSGRHFAPSSPPSRSRQLPGNYVHPGPAAFSSPRIPTLKWSSR